MAAAEFQNSHLANLFRVSSATIRNWSIEFASYLSASATPPEGGTRFYTVGDLEVMTWVATRKREGATYETIHVELKSGSRADAPVQSPEHIKTKSADEIQEMAMQQMEKLQITIVDLKQQLANAKELASQVEEVSREKFELKTQLEMTQQALDEQKAEIQRIRDELSKAQGELGNALREQGQQYAKGYRDAMRDQLRGPDEEN